MISRPFHHPTLQVSTMQSGRGAAVRLMQGKTSTGCVQARPVSCVVETTVYATSTISPDVLVKCCCVWVVCGCSQSVSLESLTLYDIPCVAVHNQYYNACLSNCQFVISREAEESSQAQRNISINCSICMSGTRRRAGIWGPEKFSSV